MRRCGYITETIKGNLDEWMPIRELHIPEMRLYNVNHYRRRDEHIGKSQRAG